MTNPLDDINTVKFTDDDLKRLKERLDAGMRHVDPYCPSFDRFELSALLARLEAAEEKGKAALELFEAGQAICDPNTYFWLEEKFKKSEEAWRKVAGK